MPCSETHVIETFNAFSCEESIGPKLGPVKQEEAAPLSIASGAADTDAEGEAIHERIESLEKEERRAELLGWQNELEDEVRSSTVPGRKERH